MKRSKKVYGVYNLVEWYANIKAGKATVRVLFSGGAMTTQGVTPATFTTTDPIVQFTIEHSEQFRSGKIKLLKTYPTNEDVEVERNAPKVNAPLAQQTTQVIEVEPQQTEATTDEVAEDTEEISTAEEAIVNEMPTTDGNKTIVKVTCDRDAAEYLREKHGIALSKLRSKAAIAAAAEQYGVTFDYTVEETSIED